MEYPVVGLAFTDAEALLSELLDAADIPHQLNPRILGYRSDVWVTGTKLLIECDGAVHLAPQQQHRDACRQKILEKAGYTVLRFKNESILRNSRRVIAAIQAKLNELG